ncbi:hypothetical protein BZ164_18905 [Pseudomonas veronii]|jgi:Zn finger protein HypA/HybF involved in hydrogenase expression|nr:hypothetical protein BZ164_18905 [Pseudomonas veronii]
MSTLAPITHWCRNCDAHHPAHRVRSFIPVSTVPEGKQEFLVCPNCSSYEIEPLQEVSHAD